MGRSCWIVPGLFSTAWRDRGAYFRRLVRIVVVRAVVDVTADSIIIHIVKCRIRTRIAGVPDSVAVGIYLVRVEYRRAIVIGLTDAILIRVIRRTLRTGIARVAEAVAISIRLIWVGDIQAVVF